MINKDEFIKKLAKNMETSQKDAKACMEAMLQTMMDCFYEGQGIQFIGFGTFRVTMVKERTCCNPRTGEEMKVPAHKQVVFRPGKTLKMKH